MSDFFDALCGLSQVSLGKNTDYYYMACFVNECKIVGENRFMMDATSLKLEGCISC